MKDRPVAVMSPREKMDELVQMAKKLDKVIVVTTDRGLRLVVSLDEFLDDVQHVINILLDEHSGIAKKL